MLTILGKIFSPSNWVRFGVLLLSLLIWINVVLRSQYEYKLKVPILIEEIPENLIRTTSRTDSVVIKFSTTGRNIVMLKFNSLYMNIQGTQFKKGINTVTLTNEHLNKPKNIRLGKLEIVKPIRITVGLDKLSEKKIKVINKVSIAPQEGWLIVGESEITPREVRIKGPHDYLRKVSSVSTDTLTLQQVANTVSVQVGFQINHSVPLEFKPKFVTYSAAVQRLAERTITEIPVTLRHVPKNIKAVLDTPFITLTLIGGEVFVSQLHKNDIKVSVNYGKFDSSTDDALAASIIIPHNIRWVNARPQKFRIKEKIIVKRKFK